MDNRSDLIDRIRQFRYRHWITSNEKKYLMIQIIRYPDEVETFLDKTEERIFTPTPSLCQLVLFIVGLMTMVLSFCCLIFYFLLTPVLLLGISWSECSMYLFVLGLFMVIISYL